MEKQDLYYIYDSVWAGMYTDFKPFCEENEQKMAPEDILEICRYAFRYYLRWNADAVHMRLTEDVLKQMKLYSLVRTYPFPEEISKQMQIPYLVGKLYPQFYRFDPENWRSHPKAFSQTQTKAGTGQRSVSDIWSIITRSLLHARTLFVFSVQLKGASSLPGTG